MSNALWCIWDMVRAPHGWVVCSGATFEMEWREGEKTQIQILVASLTEMHQIPNVVLVTGRLKGKWKALMSRIFFFYYFPLRFSLWFICVLPGRPLHWSQKDTPSQVRINFQPASTEGHFKTWRYRRAAVFNVSFGVTLHWSWREYWRISVLPNTTPLCAPKTRRI